MEEMVSNSSYSRPILERRERPQKEQHLNCPRCSSIHTKFCYYNNYSLTQPRYFCKTCRRYWTQGGALRNVPVGGSSRKNKRPSTPPPPSSSSASTSLKKIPDLTPPSYSSHNPNINTENNNKYPSSSSTSSLELLRTGITSMGLSLSSLTQMPTQGTNTDYPLGFGLQGFKASIDFGVHEIGGGGYGNLQGVQGGDKKLLLPFEDLRQVSSTTDHHFEQNRGQQGDSTGYWVGMLGGSSR